MCKLQTPLLSKRGQERTSIPADTSTEKWYDKVLNPQGMINLASAENTLMSDEILEYIHENFKLTVNHLKYHPALVHGFASSTVNSLPRFMNRTLRPRVPITRNNLVVCSALSVLFAHLFWHLCEEGEGVLMSTPYYADYPRDIIYPANAVVAAAHVPLGVDPLSLDVIPIMRDRIRELATEGTRVAVIVLNNPHNPLGRVYPTETIIAYAALAEEFNVHLLVDELFANQIFASKHTPNPKPFKSILSLDIPITVCNPARIYVVGGPGKDFGSSGIQTAAFISQHNEDVFRVISTAFAAGPVTSAGDAIFTSIMDNELFCDWFLAENSLRIGKAFELIADWCEFHKFTYIKTQAALFTLVDFEPLIMGHTDPNLPINDRVDQFMAILNNWGVRMKTPMESEDQVRTRCRVVYTMPEERIKIAFYRIEKAFNLAHWHTFGRRERRPYRELKD